MDKKRNILMCGSALINGGGVVSVTKNYLKYDGWGDLEIAYLPTHINGNVLKKVIFFLNAYLKILYRFSIKKVDIVHLHTCDGGPFFRKSIILFTAKIFGIRTVLHHHTDYESFFMHLGKAKKKFVKMSLRSADVNIVLGGCLKKQILNFEPEAKVEIIRNGITVPESNQYNIAGHNVLFLGWFQDIKGFFTFLDAFKLIEPEIDKKIGLVLCGGGTAEEMKRIREYRLQERIRFMGWADEKKKTELFKDVMINILPSYNEGLPMSIIETMAYGIPNIATNITTIPEIIDDGISGFIVEAGDVRGLSERLLLLINDVAQRKKFSNMSYEKIASSFSVTGQMEMTKDLYNILLS